MIEALIVDGLFILILILLIPLGAHRGGVREVCSAAGLLLGILIVQYWAVRWGDWVAARASIDQEPSRFIVAVAVLVTVTTTVGYGASASFATTPGPGGRLFGGLLGLLIGVVALGTLVGYVTTYLYEGITPRLIQDSYVARGVSAGLDWILIGIAGVLVLATLFGAVVRERELDVDMMPMPRRLQPAPALDAPPVPASDLHATAPSIPPDLTTRSTAVKVREVRHWEEAVPTSEPARSPTGEWTQTWPADRVSSGGRARPSTGDRQSRGPDHAAGSNVDASDDGSMLREWLASDDQPDDEPGKPRRP